MLKNDLEERTEKFVKKLITLVKRLPKTRINFEYGIQVIRSGGSTGANYCEATESDSRVDFIRRIKITKREAKETRYWLKLLKFANPEFDDEEFDLLIKETTELVLIFSKTIQTAKFKR